jgi:RNA polymerase-binding transcription factor DksA
MAVKKKAAPKRKATRKSPTKKKTVAKKTAKKKATRKPSAKKKPARKATKKKVVKKSAAKKKATSKAKTPARKAAGKKAPTKKKAAKAAVKKAPAKKVGKKKTVAKKAPPPPRISVAPRPAPAPAKKARKMGKRDLEFFRKLLLNLRDQVVDEISFLAGNNLNREHVASSNEDGTDNFERELAMKMVGSEQDLVYEIDEALGRIKSGTYGICEISGNAIERERLKVLPHARYSVQVQSEMERGRTRYRPFGPTLSRSISD